MALVLVLVLVLVRHHFRGVYMGATGALVVAHSVVVVLCWCFEGFGGRWWRRCREVVCGGVRGVGAL
jgi:hypothetical protein